MRSYGNAGTAPKNAAAAATAKEILKSAEAAKDTPAEKIPAEEISGQIINFSAMPDKFTSPEGLRSKNYQASAGFRGWLLVYAAKFFTCRERCCFGPEIIRAIMRRLFLRVKNA